MADQPHDPQALREQWKSGWDGAMGFRYTGGSGMGNPRASCPKRYRFR